MSFMQKSLLFWEGLISNSVILVVCTCLLFYNRTCFHLLIAPTALLFIILTIQMAWKKTLVTINENGITCQRETQELWAYRWVEIAELRIGNQLRNPCVEIIIKNDCHPEEKVFSGSWFQLGVQAKRAIKRYSQCPVIW